MVSDEKIRDARKKYGLERLKQVDPNGSVGIEVSGLEYGEMWAGVERGEFAPSEADKIADGLIDHYETTGELDFDAAFFDDDDLVDAEL